MKTKLVLKDEVNCKFEGLALTTRRKLEKKLKFFLPYVYAFKFKFTNIDLILKKNNKKEKK